MRWVGFCMGIAVICMVTGCSSIPGVISPEVVTELIENGADPDVIAATMSDQHAHYAFLTELAESQRTQVEVPMGSLMMVMQKFQMGQEITEKEALAATIKIKEGTHMAAPARPKKISESLFGFAHTLVKFAIPAWAAVEIADSFASTAGNTNMNYGDGEMNVAGGDVSSAVTTTSTEMLYENEGP
jgi:hypothetical protein